MEKGESAEGKSLEGCRSIGSRVGGEGCKEAGRSAVGQLGRGWRGAFGGHQHPGRGDSSRSSPTLL